VNYDNRLLFWHRNSEAGGSGNTVALDYEGMNVIRDDVSIIRSRSRDKGRDYAPHRHTGCPRLPEILVGELMKLGL